MSAKPSEINKQLAAPVSPAIVEVHTIHDDLKKLTKAIERRAFEFFKGRGAEPGHELEDWFKAESELMRPVLCELKETDECLTIKVEAPGFHAEDLKLSVEPDRIFIRGSKDATTKEEKDNTIYTECYSNEMFRTLYLPAEVDPSKVTAELKDGVLKVTLPKVVVTRPAEVEVTV